MINFSKGKRVAGLMTCADHIIWPTTEQIFVAKSRNVYSRSKIKVEVKGVAEFHILRKVVDGAGEVSACW